MMQTATTKDLFNAALEISDPKERSLMLERACAGNLELRAQVEELIESASEAEGFFADCLTAVSTITRSGDIKAVDMEESARQIQATLGTKIGPYKVLEVIGEGGCGVVYTAEQESPVRRMVALKIIKLGMDTKSVIARFKAEQQALAMMDHPNIARVLDAGATDAGRPYFVMELVHGIRLTTYCDQGQMDISQRLNLFIQVCHAVQHAHQKGIIHRDIKPSNILVAMVDGIPVPKVIDFGIAKAISGKLTEATSFTSPQQFIGTPAYISPEQAQMSTMDVDTRSDIYSLGVLLYELLTGRTPFDTAKLLESGLDALRRALREREPTRLSNLIATLPSEELGKVAKNRHSDPARLGSLFRNDLDWIVIKALEKDRNRRYQTANGLALDVQRYLDNEPVFARAPSRIYRFQKLVRRNKVVFTAAGAVVLVLMACSALATWLMMSTFAAQKRAVTAEHEKVQLQGEADRMKGVVENDRKFLEVASLARSGKIQKADALIKRVQIPKLDLQFVPVYESLGDYSVSQGNWQDAIDRFEVLFRINEACHVDNSVDNLRDDSRFAVTLVSQGRLQEYEQFRNDLIARISNPVNPDAAQEVLKDCLLAPPSKEIMADLAKYAEVTSASLNDSKKSQLPPKMMAAFYCYSLALYAYRGGNYAEAINWCEQSNNFDKGLESRDVGIHLIRAMSLAKSGKLDEARGCFESSRSIIENNFAFSHRTRQWNGYWFDQVFAQILLREAKVVLALGNPGP